MWKVVRFQRNREFLSKLELWYRFQSVAIRVVYHFVFLYLFISQYIPTEDKPALRQMLAYSWKYCGFIIIACLVVGGLFDIIYVLLESISWTK